QSIAADTASQGYGPVRPPAPGARGRMRQPSQRAAANEATTSTGEATATIASYVAPSPITGRRPQYQIEFVVMSALRSPWKRNDAHQPRKPSSANGRLTAATVAIAAASTAAAPRTSAVVRAGCVSARAASGTCRPPP